MITTEQITKERDEAVKRFYANTSFDQSGGKLDAMKLTQKESEAEEAKENEDGGGAD